MRSLFELLADLATAILRPRRFLARLAWAWERQEEFPEPLGRMIAALALLLLSIAAIIKAAF